MFANTRNDHAKFDLAKSSGADFGGNRPSSLPSEVDFRQMVRRLYPLIEREVRMIWKQSFLQHERDDIVSEVALGLYSMLMMGKLQHSLREDDIRRLIRKLALDQYRRMEREARYGDIDPSVFVNFNIIPDDKPNPEEQTMDKELSVQLNDYINTNFDAAARALLLDWVSGNSSLELAKKYNISQASAHQRVNRMLTRLRSVSAGQM
jgi:RNA polymerase sigma factor (sigma-70 family)